MNSNFKYRVDNEDIIVNPEENEIIKNKIKSGASVVYLRDDTLALNVNFIRYIKETNEPTIAQQDETDNGLKLNAPQWVEPSDDEAERRKIVLDSYKNTSTSALFGGGEKKDCTRCGENHYIPVVRDMCLPCLIKTIKEGKVAGKKEEKS
jgi:hypothetical protein